MNLLLFEVIGELPETYIFAVMGFIGFGLGYFRWWLGLIWFIFPLLLFEYVQIEEINSLYEAIVRESNSYIWQSYLSITIGVLVNVTGIFLGIHNIFKKKKLNFT
jgi:hypothetical protein